MSECARARVRFKCDSCQSNQRTCIRVCSMLSVYIPRIPLHTHARMGECVRARMSAFCRTKLTRLSRQRINKSALTMNPPVCYYPIITGTQLQARVARVK